MYEQKASWADKAKYSDTWILIIKHATLARIQSSNPEYYRSIDILIVVLLSEERIKAKAMKNLLINKGLEGAPLYDKLLEYIIDILDKAGYLTKKSITQQGGVDLADIKGVE